MSVELILARFGPESGGLQDSTLILRLADVVRSVLREYEFDEKAVFVLNGGQSIEIDLLGGTAQVHYEFAQFPINELDPATVRVVFETAKAGDMVILTEGGKYPAIVTNVTQRTELPTEWQKPELTPVCQSGEHLELLLQDWFKKQKTYRKLPFGEPQEKATLPASPGCAKMYKCVDGELREITKDDLSQERVVDLQRFDPTGYQRPKHPSVIRDLANVATSLASGECTGIGGGEARPNAEFSFKFAGGSADVYPSRAVFYITNFDLPVCRVIFEIARTGDLAIIPRRPDGNCRTILTSPEQLRRVPEGWDEGENSVAVCLSSEELVPVLQRSLEIGKRWQFSPEPWPVLPDTRPGRAEIVYVEAKPKETTATKHQKKIYDFHRDYSHKYPERCSGRGILMSCFWRLETPEGKFFYAYSYGGSPELWLTMIHQLAADESRAVGHIVNFDTFVQFDGRKFPISACAAGKVKT